MIVVGVDGSEGSERALTVAGELAANLGCRLVAVHVVHAPAAAAASTVGAGALAVSAEELADHCHMCCELVLAHVAVRWSFEVRHGAPSVELLRAASGAACVVVGRHGHGRLARGCSSDR